MKFLIYLAALISFNSFGSTPNVDEIFSEYDVDQNQELSKKEHRKVFRKHRAYFSKCMQIPEEQHRLEFIAYLYSVKWGVLPGDDEEFLSFFTFYGTALTPFHTTPKDLQVFIDLCE